MNENVPESAPADETTTTPDPDDDLGEAMFSLSEARDLLDIMREQSTGAQYAMSQDVRRRVDTAITALDRLERALFQSAEDDDNSAVGVKPTANLQEVSISGGSAYDDLMLRLERVETLLTAISDVDMHGEDRSIVSLATIAQSELAAAEAVAQANRERWHVEKPAD